MLVNREPTVLECSINSAPVSQVIYLLAPVDGAMHLQAHLQFVDKPIEEENHMFIQIG